MNYWSFDFSAANTEPPTSNQIRFNAIAPTAVTAIYVRYFTTDGIDAYHALMRITPGTVLFLQDRNDHTAFATFVTTGPPIDHPSSYATFPVVWQANGGTPLSNNQAIEFVYEDARASTAPPAAGGGGAASGWQTWTDPETGLHAVSIVETPPVLEPIDLPTAKLYARLSGTDLDPLFTTFIRAAREKVEIDSGYALLTQTRRIWFDRMPSGIVDLPPGCDPVQSVTTFEYIDASNTWYPIDPASYALDVASHPPRLYLNTVLVTGLRPFQPVTMSLVAGHADVDAIPAPLVHACGLLTGFYANESGDRFLAQTLWDQYDETIAPYRLVHV